MSKLQIRLLLMGLVGVIATSAHAILPGENPQRYFGQTSRFRGFDPVQSADVPSALATSRVYEGLYEYEYLVRPYTVRPLLAAALPEISPDGLTYTIRLKPGVRFAADPCFPGGEGREFVAEDVVYSWKRVADVRNRSNCYWIFEGRIRGLDEFHRRTIAGQASYDDPVEGLRALDRYTLQIKLTHPHPQLIWIMTMSYTFIVPREAVEYYGAEFINHPVGTGPFILKDWRWRNYRIVFARNPNYHGDTYPTQGEPGDRERGLLDDAGKPIPFLDEVVLYVVSDTSTAWLMFLSGQLGSSGIGRDNFDAAIMNQRELTPALKARGITLDAVPELWTTYLGFFFGDPVIGRSQDPEEDLRHKKLRQALGCSIDMQKWVKFYNNRMLPANGPIPPGIAGHDPNKPPPYPFDLERARRLLAEAGYPGGRDAKTGKRLTLMIEVQSASDPEQRQAIDLLASFFDQIGIELRATYNNYPEFLKKVERRQFQLILFGWVADYPDAENFLQLFHSESAAPGPNYACYSNPVFDRLLERARQMPDSPQRTALYQQCADIVIEDCPWISLCYPMSFSLRQPWVKNYKFHAFPYPFLKFYKVDRAEPER